jgi:hypothetical protein
VFNYSPELKHQIQIALPYYPPATDYRPIMNVQIDGTMHQAQTLQDIDALARKDLESRMAGLELRAIARMVLKKKISKEAAKEDGFAGFIANVAGIVTERADTRSWISLPQSVQLLRVPLAPGEHAVSANGLQPPRVLTLKVGDIAVVSIHELMGRNIYAVH